MSLFSFFSSDSIAQSVESKVYSATLRTLLSHSVEEVSVTDVAQDLSDYEIILDTREKAEFDVSSLPNALYVGYDNFEMSRVADLDKEAKVLLYCSVGYRSEKIAEKMRAEGFQNVVNLYGGIFEWKNQNREVVNHEGEVTEEVHAFDRIWGRFLRKGDKVYSK